MSAAVKVKKKMGVRNKEKMLKFMRRYIQVLNYLYTLLPKKHTIK